MHDEYTENDWMRDNRAADEYEAREKERTRECEEADLIAEEQYIASERSR